MQTKNILRSNPTWKNVAIAASLLVTFNLKAQTWSNVGSGMNGYVLALTEYNGNLYAGGSFTMAGGNPANNIAMWNGSTWSAVGAGVNNTVHALTVFNGNLYVGGDFKTAGGNPASEIAEWNGSTWSPLGAGLQGTYYGSYFTGGCYALTSYNGNLYAGGEFDSAGGSLANYVAEWNGTSWSALGPGLPTYYYVYALTVYSGGVYAGGWFGVEDWNGSSWATPGTLYGSTYALTVYNGNLYAGGQIYPGNVAEWNGTTWSALGTGTNEPDYGVDALIAYNGILYAGGQFDTAGGIPASNIAAWNGTTWSALGAGVNARDSAFAVYNGCLYTGGIFTTAGGNSANYIATWCTPSAIDEVSSTDGNEHPYPNPSSSLIYLNYNLPEGMNTAEMVITNLSGQVVKTCNVGNTFNHILLDTKQYAPGEYFYYINTDNYKSATGKFIISR